MTFNAVPLREALRKGEKHLIVGSWVRTKDHYFVKGGGRASTLHDFKREHISPGNQCVFIERKNAAEMSSRRETIPSAEGKVLPSQEIPSCSLRVLPPKGGDGHLMKGGGGVTCS